MAKTCIDYLIKGTCDWDIIWSAYQRIVNMIFRCFTVEGGLQCSKTCHVEFIGKEFMRAPTIL